MPPRKKGRKRSSTESKDDSESNYDSTDLLSPSEVVKMRKKSQQPAQEGAVKEAVKSEKEGKTATGGRSKVGKGQPKVDKKEKEKGDVDKKKEPRKHKKEKTEKDSEPKKLKGVKEKSKALSKKRVRSDASDGGDHKSVLFPCGICTKEVCDTDEAILCEAGCEFWYHRKCAGMTDIAYQLLTNEEHAEWVCDKCIATKSVPLVKIKSVLEAVVTS